MPAPSNGPWTGARLDRVAMPMGGMGAGMIAFEGAGKLSQASIRNAPRPFHEPYTYAAATIRPRNASSPKAGASGDWTARVLEGPVPAWKVMHPWGAWQEDSGTGGRGRTYGLPRLADAAFTCRFPFGEAALSDPAFPVTTKVTGWSPFIPLDADASSLPVAAVEYELTNRGSETLDVVFSFHSRNLLVIDPRHYDAKHADFTPGTVGRTPHGFTFHTAGFEDAPELAGHFAAEVDAADAGGGDAAPVSVDAAWFRGGWFDAQSVVWRNVAEGRVIDAPPHAEGKPSDGGSLYVPFTLAPGQTRKLVLRLSWYVPVTAIGGGPRAKGQVLSAFDEVYVPWYAGRFDSLEAVAEFWRTQYDDLRRRTLAFTDALYGTTLPAEVIEAVACNLGILKSPTVLRQTDGRLWGWEGCFDQAGCCPGSCTHVWNYAQALPHLFPELERSLRETEFEVGQASEGEQAGHQAFRMALPISTPKHDWHAAADGQLGGVLKAYRDWRIAGDEAWLRRLWPKMKQSVDFAIRTWDPDHTGVPDRPHHNTYDIEFWGPNGMIGSFYVAALKAMVAMGETLGDVDPLWPALVERGKAKLEGELFNGEYFFHRVDPAAGTFDPSQQTPEAAALFEREGPKYQYGEGCLSDGVLGCWMAETAGLPPVLDEAKIAAHLDAVFRHNFRTSLADHANTQRPGYGLGDEAGLLLCSWPRGQRLTLPFPYADEVWTGIEYQVASHLMMIGRVEEGLAIVRAVRQRFDGTTRNPFDEYECGHWYARAMASYGLLQGLTGIRYDAVERTLYVRPSIALPFTSFLCTATGFGTVRVERDDVKVNVVQGEIAIDRIQRASV